MKISAKADYACIAVLELARQFEEDRPVSISTISDRHGVSRTFLVHIMKDLKEDGIVDSIRGAKGGYHLARAPAKISVADVIRAIEGPMVDVRCMHPPDEEGCELEPTCDLQSVWDVIKLRVVSVLEDLSFDEVHRLTTVFEGTEKGSEEHREVVRQEVPGQG